MVLHFYFFNYRLPFTLLSLLLVLLIDLAHKVKVQQKYTTEIVRKRLCSLFEIRLQISHISLGQAVRG